MNGIAAFAAIFAAGMAIFIRIAIDDVQKDVSRISRIQVCEITMVRDTDEWHQCIERAEK